MLKVSSPVLNVCLAKCSSSFLNILLRIEYNGMIKNACKVSFIRSNHSIRVRVLAFDARKKDDRGHPFFVAEKARFELALQFITVLTP